MKFVIEAVWNLELLSMFALGFFVKKTDSCDSANIALQ